jgi:hypothetical protein
VRVRVDEELIVGARLHARAAPDAGVAVEVDDPVAPLEQRVSRTDANAGRLLTLVAEDREEEPPRIGERPLLDRLHPAAVRSDWNLVLRLARDRARMAPDALSEIDGEPVVWHPEISHYIKSETRHQSTAASLDPGVPASPQRSSVGAERAES